MTFIQGQGNLLTQNVDALVNTVNTQGVMGKGIALQFKKAWPEMFKAYQAASKRGEVVPGRMHVWETGLITGPRFIINFPTKRHWRSRSKIGDIEAGLQDLRQVIQDRGIESIAVPPLGCGNGGLDWSDVYPRIMESLEPVAADVEIRVFAPAGAPAADQQPVAEKAPNLTAPRAALLALMREYQQSTFEPPSQISVQKLAYFLQNGGQPLRLNFEGNRYGPYDDNLRKSLRAMEGHFISGFGDGSVPVLQAEPIRLRNDVEPKLADYLESDPETAKRVHQVIDDIDGFESAYGLELLATVHWVMSHSDEARQSWQDAYREVRKWSQRKATLFTETHVEAAWTALKERDLLHQ